MIVLAAFGSDEQFPQTIVDRTHCLGCISDEIQDDLLKLHAVTLDRRNVGRQVEVDRDLVQIRVAMRDALDDAD